MTQTATDWEHAPDLLTGARTLELTPEQCDLDYWLTHVAGGSLQGLEHGHRPEARTPEFMREAGPLRDALISEFAFQAIAEQKATRAISALIPLAPDLATLEFYVTQLVDEARHARTFRGHLTEIGVPAADLGDVIEDAAGQDARGILFPLEAYGLGVLGRGDFYGGVTILTILVEGVLAPTTELSERKWRCLDPAAAEVQRGAGVDEIRHLTVGSTIVRRYVHEYPAQKARLLDLITAGRQLWDRLPLTDLLYRQESLFSEGIRGHADLIGDYEVWPGRRLLDTTAQERLDTARAWSRETQDARLAYMGLPEAAG